MRLPFVISIPHCSHLIPDEIRSSVTLTEREILESTDRGTREIFATLPTRVTLWARWSRLVADLNRDPEQRDQKGVVPLVDYYKRKIYKEDHSPDEEEVERRLKEYYWPFHNRLKEAVRDPAVRVLFDCHSLSNIGPPGAPDPLKYRKDIVLGNNGDYGGEINPSRGEITCPTETLQMMKQVFEDSGFSVSVNHPYPGGFITSHYGEGLIREGKWAVQIEINEELYLDRENLRFRMAELAELSKRLHHVFREINRRL